MMMKTAKFICQDDQPGCSLNIALLECWNETGLPATPEPRKLFQRAEVAVTFGGD
jgi:hypothetical protein